LIITHKIAIRNIIIISIVFFSITFQVNQTYSFFTLLNDQLEYKVNTGDSRTYEYIKFFDNRLDTPYQAQINVIDINGISQVFTIKDGSRFEITVTSVTNNEISGTRTIDEVTYEEEMIASFIRPMTNNMSLLAESFIGSTSFEVQGDQVIEQLNESSFYSEGVYYDLNRARTSIWEKSGWLNYQSIRVYDTEGVLMFDENYVPAIGSIIEASFDFYYRVRFISDQFEDSNFELEYYNPDTIWIKEIKRHTSVL